MIEYCSSHHTTQKKFEKHAFLIADHVSKNWHRPGDLIHRQPQTLVPPLPSKKLCALPHLLKRSKHHFFPQPELIRLPDNSAEDFADSQVEVFPPFRNCFFRRVDEHCSASQTIVITEIPEVLQKFLADPKIR